MKNQEHLPCALAALATFAVALGKHLDNDDNLMAFGPTKEWSAVLETFAPFFGGEGQTRQ